ncbi:MFS peptide transporter [Rhizodiscina lignyota]|uniref:MFS peptide transporter n=1 Tax=Rhizodiscina lignyota TaxID=1504668 RepID=A0A9P4M1S2_9PEZI|nr:MFS peptide transporter [Rhizodiscina lignyota]
MPFDSKGSIATDIQDIPEETIHSVDDTDNQDEAYPEPTEEERITLRKVPAKIPLIAYSLCLAEFAERASYYGISGVSNNFMQFPLPKGGNGAGAPPRGTELTAGALGRGLQFSSSFKLFFSLLGCLIPLFVAWVADAKIGRYKAIVVGVAICLVSHVVIVVGALPSVLQKGTGTAPYMIGRVLLSVSCGLLKPTLLPTFLDQYRHQREYTEMREARSCQRRSPADVGIHYANREMTQEKVLVDPETTIQRMALDFSWFVNLGAFFSIATAYAEKFVGWWLAFLLPLIVNIFMPIVMAVTYKQTYRAPPKGEEVTGVFRILSLAIRRNRGRLWKSDAWEEVKPSTLKREGITAIGGKPIIWSEQLVEDVRRAMTACSMFLFLPLYFINISGVGSIATSQGSTLTKKHAPNDLLYNVNPLTILVFVPFLTYVVYPALRKYGIEFKRVNRMVLGFVLCAFSGAVGAILQWHVYRTSPCLKFATGCEVEPHVSPLSVWVQVPMYALSAAGEPFVLNTSYEIAYARAPPNMKTFVLAAFYFMHAVCNLLGLALMPLSKDPYLVWLWAGPAIALLLQTGFFWWMYNSVNDDEFMVSNRDDYIDDREADIELSKCVADIGDGSKRTEGYDDQRPKDNSGEPEEAGCGGVIRRSQLQRNLNLQPQ